MKIIFVCSEINQIGGIQQYNRKFLQVLSESNTEVILIERKSEKLSKLKFTYSFFRHVIFSKPDIIFCRHVHYAPLAYLAKKIFKIRYTLSFYGIDAINLSIAQKTFLKAAEFVTVPFEWTRQNLLKQNPSLQDKILVIMNPVDENEFFIKQKNREIIDKYKLTGLPIILTVARITKDEFQKGYKGYNRVIQALPLIKKSFPNVKYILVGGGDYLENLEEMINGLGLSGNIVLTGSVRDEERIDYYNLCDVFTLPSQGEGCPALVVLEALLCGKPVVIGKKECSENALLYGSLGLMVNPENIEEIAEAITIILQGKNRKILPSNQIREQTVIAYGFNNFRKNIKSLLTLLEPKPSIKEKS